jgi:hypothetical protein
MLQINNNDSGKHLHGPHPADDIDPHTLNAKVTLPAVDIAFGKSKAFSGKYFLEHPSTDGFEHHDHYTIDGTVTPNAGLTNSVQGDMTLTGEHCGSNPGSVTVAAGPTMGSAGAGSLVAYDAASGMLTLTVASLNVLNTTGGTSAGIAAAYVSDPVRLASVSITPLHYTGQVGGKYRFGPGTLTVNDPAGKFHFTASFSQYLISSTSTATPGTYSSYAEVEDLCIIDVGDAVDGPSAYLRDFRNEHMKGKNSAGAWIGIPETNFTFVTGANLAQATSGFTQSASAPMDFVLTANRHALAPAAVTDLGVIDSTHQGPLVSGATLAPGQIQWYGFSIAPPGAADPSTWLDIDTAGSTLSNSNDTMIGLYDVDGQLIATDDDDGPGFTSQLSFGQRTPTRPPTGDGMPGNGRDGTLAPGYYYLAVSAFSTVFTPSNWAATSASGASGTIRVNFSTNLAAPCYANCDGSTVAPVLNVADFGCFLNKYAAGDTYANCDNSTVPPVLNVADFGCYLNSTRQGARDAVKLRMMLRTATARAPPIPGPGRGMGGVHCAGTTCCSCTGPRGGRLREFVPRGWSLMSSTGGRGSGWCLPDDGDPAPVAAPVAGLSSFPELNVRTYVRGADGRPGSGFSVLTRRTGWRCGWRGRCTGWRTWMRRWIARCGRDA